MTPHQIARQLVADHLAALTVDDDDVEAAGWINHPLPVLVAADGLCRHLTGILTPADEPDTSAGGSNPAAETTGAGEPHPRTPEPAQAEFAGYALVTPDGRCGCCNGSGEHPCAAECDSCDGTGGEPESPLCAVPHGADCGCPKDDGGLRVGCVQTVDRDMQAFAELPDCEACEGSGKQVPPDWHTPTEEAERLRQLIEQAGWQDRRVVVGPSTTTVHDGPGGDEPDLDAIAARLEACDEPRAVGPVADGMRLVARVRQLEAERDQARWELERIEGRLAVARAGRRQARRQRDEARAELAKTDKLGEQAIAAEARAVRELESELETTRQEAVRFAAELGFGDNETDPAAPLADMIDPIRDAMSAAEDHDDCPTHCEACGETLAATVCQRCHGAGDIGTTAHEECPDCAGAGKVHEGCVGESYADLVRQRYEARQELDERGYALGEGDMPVRDTQIRRTAAADTLAWAARRLRSIPGDRDTVVGDLADLADAVRAGEITIPTTTEESAQ